MNPWKPFPPTFRYRNRAIRITTEGLIFLFLTVLIGVLAINTANNMLYLLMALMLTVVAVSGILSEWSLKGVWVSHTLPPQVHAHDPVTLRWCVRNGKSLLPVYALQIVARYPHTMGNEGIAPLRILPGETQWMTSTLTFTRRGMHSFEGYELSTRFPFGLFEKSLLLRQSASVLVFPRIYPLWIDREMDLSLRGLYENPRRKGAGTALRNLRDYRHGDNPRDIHWKTSARQAKLLVQERDEEGQRRVQLFFLNQQPPTPAGQFEQDFEEAVSLVASLAYFLSHRGYHIGFRTAEGEIPAPRGRSHLLRLLHHLALLTATPYNPRVLQRERRVQDRPAVLILPWECRGGDLLSGHFGPVIDARQWKSWLDRGSRA